MKFKPDNEKYQGIIFAGGAYILWGILPVYWKLLQTVPALEVLAHRIVWSVIFLWVLLAITRKGSAFFTEIKGLARCPRTILGILVTGLILNLNWGTYIWAVNHDHIIQTSLGYYINPLVSVLLGIIFLHERLSLWQMLAFLLAAAGVLSLTIQYGAFPWIAVILALSFGLYGLFKKLTNLGSITGLTLETMLTSIFAISYLIYINIAGTGAFHLSFSAAPLLLCGAGIVTAIPLLLFGAGARRLPLFLIGFLQYISPTMTLLLGVFVYHEPFTRGHLISFTVIWIGLIVFSLARTPILAGLEDKILSKAGLPINKGQNY
ncbi:rard protein [hydrocarbon metagenome]|uniref:Rard protein n=1 Tax=hydrocarbon metagenome TaxID=938273 RepID=A0A0W8E4D6_9ZZZZ